MSFIFANMGWIAVLVAIVALAGLVGVTACALMDTLKGEDR